MTDRHKRRAGTFLLAACSTIASAQEPSRFVCPVVADTTISAEAPEGRLRGGGGLDRMSVRASQLFTLMKFDVSAISADYEVTRATLRVKRAHELLVRVGVSTVATDWQEGRASKFEAEIGGACYLFASYARSSDECRTWAGSGSDFSDIAFGNGGSRWAVRAPVLDKQTLWYDIDVPPLLVQALVQGLQPGGLCISDDFGRGEITAAVFSRESKDAPELIVEARRVGTHPSAPPARVRASRDALGREWVEFDAPAALGFEIYLSSGRAETQDALKNATRVEAWSMPTPAGGHDGVAGGTASEPERVSVERKAAPLRALISLQRGRQHRFASVRVMEAAGEWSTLVVVELPPPVSSIPAFQMPNLPRVDLPTVIDAPFVMDDGPALSRDGKWIRSNHKTWWDPQKGPIELQTGRNEFTAFQVVLAGGPGAYRVSLAGWQSPGAAEPSPRVDFFREHYPRIRFGPEKYAPDALDPIEPGQTMHLDLLQRSAEQLGPPDSQPAPGTAAKSDPRAHVQAVWVDVYVPKGAARGVWKNRVLVLRDGAALLDVPIELDVRGAALPDVLNFKVSLGASDVPAARFKSASDEQAWSTYRDCQRLAHEHRATLAVTPYTPGGRVQPGFAPEIQRLDSSAGGPPAPAGENSRFDWDRWDERLRQYFDGSAFRDLPREAVPIDHFLLPLNDNWPVVRRFVRAPQTARLADKYHFRPTRSEAERSGAPNPPRDSYMSWPVERAIPPEYVSATQHAIEAFRDHVASSGWDRTDFQVCFGARAPLGADTTWWNFARPEVPDDFRALHYWLSMYRAALGESPSRSLSIRADLAWPQFQRDYLDGVVDLSTINTTLVEKSRLVLSAPQRFGTLWSSDCAIEPETGWSAALKSAWTAKLAGAHGIVAAESLGQAKSWDVCDTAALIYPPPDGAASAMPRASARLKALRRAQQDLEWFDAWRAACAEKDVPEGYYLAAAAGALIERADAARPRHTMLLPIVDLPTTPDTVAFEEFRRGLRGAVGE